MKNILKVTAAVAFVVVPMQANAITGSVPFNGTVTHTCTINVNSGGTLVADAGFQNLSSSIAGGVSGDVEVIATGNGFGLSIDVPSSFTSKPSENTTGETFSGSYLATGATSGTGSASGGSNSGALGLSNGTTGVSVDLVASKSGSDVFEAGSYEAVVTLRCE